MAFLGPESVQAAAASECAADAGTFWPYYDALASTEAPGGRNSGAFSNDALKRIAGQVGLDQASFDSCLDSGRTVARVQAETDAGKAKGVNSTPTVFINGERMQGSPGVWEDLLHAIVSAQMAKR